MIWRRRRPPGDLPLVVPVENIPATALPAIWWWREALPTWAVHHRASERGEPFGVQNGGELDAAIRAARHRGRIDDLDLAPLPSGIPAPQVVLPADFSPDFFGSSSRGFASRRLREVLALPAGAVEFAPVELLRGSRAARAQDYRLMRVLARQPAIDLHLSDAGVEEWRDQVTGRPFAQARWINRAVLLDGLAPRTELFRAEEDPTVVLATDALARRVTAAALTGVEFHDTGVSRRGVHVERLRTATGVCMRPIGSFTEPPVEGGDGQRTLHDAVSRHWYRIAWDGAVARELEVMQRKLSWQDPDEEGYGLQAREELERLQERLRERLGEPAEE